MASQKGKYRPVARAAAEKYGVPPALLEALITVESGWDPYAVSPAGAKGIAQFMPGTAAGLGIDPLKPEEALDAAAKHLAALYRNTATLSDNPEERWKLAAAGYNAGGGAVQKYKGIPPYPETQEYVKKIWGMLGLSWISDVTAGRDNPADIETDTVADKLGELNPLAAVAQLVGAILDPDSWKRVGMGVSGTILLIVSAVLIVTQTGAVTKTARAVAPITKVVSK